MLNLAKEKIAPTNDSTIYRYSQLNKEKKDGKVTLYPYSTDRNAIHNCQPIKVDYFLNIQLSIFDQRQFLIFVFDKLTTKDDSKSYEIIVSKFDIAKHYNIQDIKLIHTFVPYLFNKKNESEIINCGDHYELNKRIIDGIIDRTFYTTNTYEPISINLNNIVDRIIDDSIWAILTK